MPQHTVVSLFAGVGGIDLAFERAGAHVTAAVEIDNKARGVLADQFPDTTLFTDVTKVTAHELLATGFDPVRGIVTAGFPCQDLSVAGRRRGMVEGTRSGLWWEVVRILADLRPRWFVGENVPGLLSAVCPCRGDGSCGRPSWPADVRADGDCPGELHSVRGGACGGDCMGAHGGAMGAVLGSLAELGYGVAYRVLDAQHFGVPQRRRRVVIVGCLADDRRPVQVLLEPEGSAGDPPARESAWPEPSPDLGFGLGVSGIEGGRANTLTARDAKGPNPVKSVGNVVIERDPVSSLQAGGGDRGYRVDAEAAGGGISCPPFREVVAALTSSGVGTCGPDDNQAQAGHLIATHTHTHTFQKVIRSGARDVNGDLPPEVWDERDVAATLNLHDLGSDTRAVDLVVSATGTVSHTLTAEGHDASAAGTGRGTPIIATQRIAATLTSGGHPNSHAPGRRQEDDVNLVAFDAKAGGDSTCSGAFEDGSGITPTLQGARPHAVADETTVRRLTPVECERLQGFPDNHTATSNGQHQADSHRYKQMGNAVAVPVFEWVAIRILATDAAEPPTGGSFVSKDTV